MKKVKSILFATSAIIAMSSCTVGYPVLTTDNAIGSKVGESSYSVVLGTFITKGGDASIQKAAANGDITKIATVDFVVKGGLFKQTVSTVVTGE